MYFKSLNRGLSITTLGWQLVIMTFSVGLLGIFTGINSMFIFLGISLGVFIISGLVSEKNIRRCNVVLKSRDFFFYESKNSLFTFYVESKEKFDIYGISVSFFLLNPLVEKRRNPFLSKNIMHLKSYDSKKCESHTAKFKRGYYNKIYAVHETTFPYGIFNKFKMVDVRSEIYVLPQIRFKQKNKWFKVLDKYKDKESGFQDFETHEPYNYSIPKNRIDWKKNANLNYENWVAKSFSSSSETKIVCITSMIFDYKKMSQIDFELFLSNIMTGIDVLKQKKYFVAVDLNVLGYVEGFDTSKKFLAKINQDDTITSSSKIKKGLRVYVSVDEVVS